MPNSSPATAQLRALIADDEPVARRRLRSQLGSLAEIEVVGECADGQAVLEALPRLAPDVLFLDIRMPGAEGLEVARALPEQGPPFVVFITAFEQHAVDAFAVRAADYLLKPVSLERLGQAVARVRSLLAVARQSTAPTQLPATASSEGSTLHRLVVPSGDRMVVVAAQQIDWIESAGNYAVIHEGRGTHILRETLTQLEERLPRGRFLRISRGTIVNLDRVRELRSDSGEGHVMILADGAKLPITRGIREVQKALESIAPH